jgi:hypothetical protein
MPKLHILSGAGQWLTDGVLSLGAFVSVWTIKNYITRKATQVFLNIRGKHMALDLSKEFEVSQELKINIQLDKELFARASANYSATDGAGAKLEGWLPLRVYLPKLAKLIPGSADDFALGLAQKAAEVAVGANQVAEQAAAVAATPAAAK